MPTRSRGSGGAFASGLVINDLKASAEGKPVLSGVDLSIRPGEIHVLMGPNGSGKSSLSNLVMGSPDYTITGGEISFEGRELAGMAPEERARMGLFLGFQNPLEIPGVSVENFLRTAYNSVHPDSKMTPFEFRDLLDSRMSSLGIAGSFASRHMNEGFSGGEKKRCEMLQMAVLSPKLAILDEPDSGLDIDALKIISKAILRQAKEEGAGILLITHNSRLLDDIDPDFVHIFLGGRIVSSAKGSALALQVEADGYSSFSREAPARKRIALDA